ncbi:hypothetical protein [Trebonia sp.]|uniref:hypothetical protein n=1 Tax=Trebonia sp. TaxID=2767075 RepID=UPI00263198DA|nr:hypothetical protein [Trebonia sp.]
MFFDPPAGGGGHGGGRVIAETADSLCGLVKREAPKDFAIAGVLGRLGGTRLLDDIGSPADAAA